MIEEELKGEITEVCLIIISDSYNQLAIKKLKRFIVLTNSTEHYFKHCGKNFIIYYAYVGDFCFMYFEKIKEGNKNAGKTTKRNRSQN